MDNRQALNSEALARLGARSRHAFHFAHRPQEHLRENTVKSGSNYRAVTGIDAIARGTREQMHCSYIFANSLLIPRLVRRLFVTPSPVLVSSQHVTDDLNRRIQDAPCATCICEFKYYSKGSFLRQPAQLNACDIAYPR